MPENLSATRFQQLHVDVARNSTDDFNPFHDKERWRNIRGNPFDGPIVLGFQLESLIAHQMKLYRNRHGEDELIGTSQLRYSNYEFKFAGAVRPGQAVKIQIRESRFTAGDDPALSNRVSLYADGKLAVTGYKRETSAPLYLADIDLSASQPLSQAPDRSFLTGREFFLKRKHLMTSNAKNFLSGSLVEQTDYIDEIDGKVNFPEMFPCALLSNALLERAWQQDHDFEAEPLVYKSHQLCIDRKETARLCSNDTLHLLSRQSADDRQRHTYECYVLAGDDRTVARARIALMPLTGAP